MNFSQRNRADEEPEINLIPLIDVLMVVLIFLLVSTTYARYQALAIELPKGNGQALESAQYDSISIVVNSKHEIQLNHRPINSFNELKDQLILELNKMEHKENTTVWIEADAQTPHQDVVSIMATARQAGLSQIAFVSVSN
jgi:biopolymer transport protein ExbD